MKFPTFYPMQLNSHNCELQGTVEGKPCLPFPIGVSEMMVNLTCNTVGRVITFYKRVLTMQYGNILTLCEVEVYGHDTGMTFL